MTPLHGLDCPCDSCAAYYGPWWHGAIITTALAILVFAVLLTRSPLWSTALP